MLTGAVPVVVTARSAGAVVGQAARLAARIQDPAYAEQAGLAGIASALVARRAVLSERAVVVASSRDDALAGLVALVRGESAPNLVTGTAGPAARTVLVFPGQG